MKKLCFIIISLVITISTANAACSKPLGSYAATLSGQWWDTSGSGALINLGASTMTATFASNGSGSVTEIGKRWGILGTGRFTSSWTIPAIGTSNHTFDTTTCRGYFTNSAGKTFVYISTGSGAKLSGTYYGNDSLLLVSNFVFEKI